MPYSKPCNMKFIIIIYIVIVCLCSCLTLTLAENLRKNADESTDSEFKLILLNGVLDSEITDVNAVAMSSTGKIVYASSYVYETSDKAYLYKSADYGKTWQAITDVINVYNIATTPSGRIVYVTQVNDLVNLPVLERKLLVLKSTDFGETWSITYENFYNDPELNKLNPFPIAISSSGQHVYFSSSVLLTSNDYGESYIHHQLPRSDDNYYYDGYASPSGIAVSRTGRYAYYVNEHDFYARSTNYGSKFELFPRTFLQRSYASAVGCSESGKIVYIVDSSHGFIHKSNNFGYTFTKVSQIPTNPNTQYTSFNSIVTSKNGDIVYISNYYGPIYKSTDSASTFEELPLTNVPDNDKAYSVLSTNYKGDTLIFGYFQYREYN
uniref:Sortilin N-terminal domain-containing protein n=1 Tax=Chromulina nebulosa TaxID=96789 RepID=A0A7S0XB95_9STRA